MNRFAIFLLMIISAYGIAWAHQAPSGWEYDGDCCSNKDCNELPDSAVRETADGYEVTAGPEQNNQLSRKQTILVPYHDRRIRLSKDGKFHACYSKEFNDGTGFKGGAMLCFYAPPKGF